MEMMLNAVQGHAQEVKLKRVTSRQKQLEKKRRTSTVEVRKRLCYVADGEHVENAVRK